MSYSSLHTYVLPAVATSNNTLDDLLQRCTVRIGSVRAGGTGFFVAPGQVLTCAHVVEAEQAQGVLVKVWWQGKAFDADIRAFRPNPYPDVALLSLELTDHPCVWLDTAVQVGDLLSSYGYPEKYRELGSGDSASFSYEGSTHEHGNEFLKLKAGQAVQGLSGAPVLNRRTGGVCGIIKSTRDAGSDLGGRAVPTSIILGTFGDLGDKQEAFHQRDGRWLALLSTHANLGPSIHKDPLHSGDDRSLQNALIPGVLSTDANIAHLPKALLLAPRETLPSRVRTFAGRREELADMRTVFVSGPRTEPVVLAIHGLSGVGKTQLCREYLEQHQADYDVTYWIGAVDEAQATAGLAQLAGKLKLPGFDRKDSVQSSHAALHWLEANDSWLLVFDNASPQLLGPLLPARGSGHVLITSNDPHWASVTPHRLLLQGLAPEDAVHFLTQRTGRADPDGAARIAETFACLPLALEQAAAYIEETGIDFENYEQLLAQNRPKLLEKKSAFTNYPESVYSALRLNVDRAWNDSSSGIELLACIAFLNASGIPREFAKAVMADLYVQHDLPFDEFVFNEMITVLSMLSLISADREMITTHPLVQAFVRDTLPAEHSEAWCGFVLGELARASPGDPQDSSTWPQWESLIDHVTTAITLAKYQSWGDEYIEALYTNAGSYLHGRDRDEAAYPLLSKALEQAKTRLGDDHQQVAIAANNLIDVSADLSRVDEALALGGHAVQILTKDEVTRNKYAIELGKVYSNIGRVLLHYKHDYESARQYFMRALEIHRDQLGEMHYTTAIDINNLGSVDRAERKWADAYRHFQEALLIDRATLSPTDSRLAIHLFNLGTAAYNLKRFAEAEACLREAITINDDVQNKVINWDQLDALEGLGQTLRRLNRPAESLSYFDRAIDLSSSLAGVATSKVRAIKANRGAAAFEAIGPTACHRKRLHEAPRHKVREAVTWMNR